MPLAPGPASSVRPVNEHRQRAVLSRTTSDVHAKHRRTLREPRLRRCARKLQVSRGVLLQVEPIAIGGCQRGRCASTMRSAGSTTASASARAEPLRARRMDGCSGYARRIGPLWSTVTRLPAVELGSHRTDSSRNAATQSLPKGSRGGGCCAFVSLQRVGQNLAGSLSCLPWRSQYFDMRSFANEIVEVVVAGGDRRGIGKIAAEAAGRTAQVISTRPKKFTSNRAAGTSREAWPRPRPSGQSSLFTRTSMRPKPSRPLKRTRGSAPGPRIQ